MDKKILITGISGFAGCHLAEYLLKIKAGKIYGTYLFEDSLQNLVSTKDQLALTKVDLTETDKVLDLVKKVKPDLVFHLAALPSTTESFKNPIRTIDNNVSVQLNLLEAIRTEGLSDTLILIVSSSDVYGKAANDHMPINENTPFMPTNPYAVSKITQDYFGLQYFLSYNMKIVRVRPFNHIGPRQSPGFVVSSFAQRIAQIEKGKLDPILKVGNLDTKRDFTDVRDIVRGYSMLLEKGVIGDVYNIGSGKSVKISDIVEKLLSFSKTKIRVEVDPTLLRPTDNPELICDNTKMKKLTGWEMEYSLDETLKETLDYWRDIV